MADALAALFQFSPGLFIWWAFVVAATLFVSVSLIIILDPFGVRGEKKRQSED